ncbi:MAG TPA: PDZ domain-containing protein, partial [Bacteroidetes bacterium]|nr:PDZ domain-containing protein [Bacteroidota bacterium]
QVESVADDFGSSDQKSFLDAQVPAVQFFSGVHLDYHRPSDTADKIDAAGMVKVAAIVREAVEYLAGREQPMTAQFAGKQAAQQARPRGGSGRRVSFGSVPDFAFSGPGVRITGTTPGSAAEKAGLKKGDVIISLAGKEVKTLRDLSTVLRALNPGDEIDVRWLREGRELQAKTTVSAR